MSTLQFNPDNHTYWLGERRLPSVTEVINRIAPQRDTDDWYLQRGAAVHAAINLALRHNLDWSSVDERIKGRVDSAMSFLKDVGITPASLEVPLCSITYQFAGTVDACGTDADERRVLVDWKGSLSPQVEPQLGGYSLLLSESWHRGLNCAVAVETHDDGSYKCRWFSGAEVRRAQQTFLAMLTTFNWLETNKIKPQ